MRGQALRDVLPPGLFAPLGGGQSSAPVETLHPVTADGGMLPAGVGRMAGRADLDRQLRCGRTGCERRSARRAADVDQMQLWMMSHGFSFKGRGTCPYTYRTLDALRLFLNPRTAGGSDGCAVPR